MRLFRVVGIVALGVSAACSDPTGPELTRIVVTLDWPLAREPGFVDARWQLIRYDPESPDLLGPRGPVVQSGVIDSSGTSVVRYDASCDGGEFGSTGHRIEVFGHFEANEGTALPECSTWAPHRCTSVPQTVGLPSDLPFEECGPPED
jgi:hypothetical protein